eukprot:4133809-Alexandrium_andersonii.AAC.1
MVFWSSLSVCLCKVDCICLNIVTGALTFLALGMVGKTRPPPTLQPRCYNHLGCATTNSLGHDALSLMPPLAVRLVL